MKQVRNNQSNGSAATTLLDTDNSLRRRCDCGNHLGGAMRCNKCGGSSQAQRFENKGSQQSRESTAAPLSRSPNSIPSVLRDDLEHKYGQSLAGVSLHTDGAAANMAKKHRADAVCDGEDIYLGRGRYRPQHAEGRRLIDHEVVHVLQQRLNGSPATLETAEAEARSLAGRPADSAAVRSGIRPRPGAPLTSAASLKQAMEDELDDVFVGMDNVWPAIRNEQQADRQQIFTDYALRANARSNASAMDLLKTYLLLNYGDESAYPAHYTALLDATDFAGTHEARIYALFRGVSQTERLQMRAMPGVKEVVEDEMSGDELKLAKQLLFSNQTHAGSDISTARPSTHLERDDRLNVAFEVRRDDSLEELASEIEDAGIANLIDDTSLWATVADNFGAAEVWYLRMIARAGSRSQLTKLPGRGSDDSYVKQIWDTVKGAGTSEEELTAILAQVNNHPAERLLLLEDSWFVYMLKDELSGSELHDATDAIGYVGGSVPAIKEALIDAINDEDRGEIRRLLRDRSLSAIDRDRLRNDPEVLLEIGDDLEGPLRAETSLLLLRRTRTTDESNLLKLFYADPINVQDVVNLLSGMRQADQDRLRETPGIFFMFLDSGLSAANRNRVLAAIRSNDPRWQSPGSEGTHRTVNQSLQVNLPVSFTTEEIRVPIRATIDEREASSGFRLESEVMEDWNLAVDEDWNEHFQLASGNQVFPLVFVPYMARQISNPNLTIFPYDNTGRRSFVRGALSDEMHLFVGEDGDELETTTFSHEFGHVLGNPDEYALTAAEYQRFLTDTLTDTPDFEGSVTLPPPRGGQDSFGMLANQRSSTDVYARHAGAATEIANRVRDQSVFRHQFVITRIEQ